jgi:plastocyanin
VTGARAAAVLLATGVAAAAVIPAASGASSPVKKTVKVGDDYFAPAKLSVPRNSTIAFKWLAANVNTHDVKLRRGPKGVKRFHSQPATAYFTYRRKLTVKGTYVVVCTFHVGMVTRITVR